MPQPIIIAVLVIIRPFHSRVKLSHSGVNLSWVSIIKERVMTIRSNLIDLFVYDVYYTQGAQCYEKTYADNDFRRA